jgi:hypothetical protein
MAGRVTAQAIGDRREAKNRGPAKRGAPVRVQKS